MSIPKRLQARLSTQLGWEVAMPARTYASRRQLEAFCLSWTARKGVKDEVCSIFTMSDCLKANELKITWKNTTFCWDVTPVNQ